MYSHYKVSELEFASVYETENIGVSEIVFISDCLHL